MRCTQPYGLPEEAKLFLKIHAVRKDPCDHCGRDSGYTKKEVGIYGMFDEMPLFEYTLADGNTATEFVQHEVWSSGPMVWLGLRTSDGQELLWAESEMAE